MMMSVWTRAVEKEAEVQTTGFVDDSAVKEKRDVSMKFGQRAGTKFNNKKVKMIVTDEKQKKLWKESSSRRSSSAPRPLCWLEAR